MSLRLTMLGSRRGLACVALALLLAACGGGESEGTKVKVLDPDVSGLSDVAQDGEGSSGSAVADVDGRDLPAKDRGPAGDRGDGGADSRGLPTDGLVIGDAPATPGAFGSPCTENSDCDSGLCAPAPGGSVCSTSCVDTCPAEGWSCKLMSLPGQDPALFCLYRWLHLCRPCATSADCRAEGADQRGECVRVGALEGSFCGVSCGPEDACPEGYTCVEVPGSGAEETALQCVPDVGTCSCSLHAVGQGASTPCERDGCLGSRLCLEGGLTDCDAAVRADERCDGVDNDCDGDVDEDFLSEGLYATFDHCGGCGRSCAVAVENGRAACVLEGGAPHCVQVGCNEGYEEAPGGGCVEIPDCGSVADCDDGDACTDDVCLPDGSCAHEPRVCDDEEECTEDGCDPEKGCTFVPVEGGTPCEDGDLCTFQDTCSAGFCRSGLPLECDDENPCTDDACAADGCTHTPNDSTHSCYEGPRDTEGVGLCAPGMLTCDGAVPSACEGQVLPSAEICDGDDNDCTGVPDEGCSLVGVDVEPVSARGSGGSGSGVRAEFSVGVGVSPVPDESGAPSRLDLGLYRTSLTEQ